MARAPCPRWAVEIAQLLLADWRPRDDLLGVPDVFGLLTPLLARTTTTCVR